MLTTPLIEHILTAIPHKSVGLLGDLFLDRYLDIDPARDEPSVETGKTAYQVTGVRSYPGALGTVLNNLAALGVGTIRPVTLIGDDGEGYELQQALRAIPAVKLDGVLLASDRRTPTYTKPIYGTEELNRLDIKNRTSTPDDYVSGIINHLYTIWSKVDAWIVLDQVSEDNCGVVTAKVREHVAHLAHRHPKLFVLADSRRQIGQFRNVAVKPNERECYEAVWVNAPKKYECGFEPLDLSQIVSGAVYCTKGQKGIDFVPPMCDGAGTIRTIPAYPVSGPIDVCGAGDSCSAGITCAMTAGASPEQAAAFGNLVASITIQQIGVTGTAAPGQVRARWKDVG